MFSLFITPISSHVHDLFSFQINIIISFLFVVVSLLFCWSLCCDFVIMPESNALLRKIFKNEELKAQIDVLTDELKPETRDSVPGSHQSLAVHLWLIETIRFRTVSTQDGKWK